MKKTILMKSLMVASLAFALVLAPMSSAFADNNKGRSEDKIEKREMKREDKKEKKERKGNSCLKAYGHLVAPGWVKLNGNANVAGRCWFPFGIGKKFETEVVDVTPPTISAVVALAQNNSVSVGWHTNEKATTKVYYGNTTPLVTTAVGTLSVQSTDLEKKHLINVPNLTANTQYYMIIESKDAVGNTQTSTEFSATTGI